MSEMNLEEALEALSKARTELAMRKQSLNPIVVVRAIALYAYNVRASKRVEDWWEIRHPGIDMQDYDSDKWIRRFERRGVPEEMDPWSLVAYVQAAMNRYGEEAARQYGSCGFYTTEQIMSDEDPHQFGSGADEVLKEVSGNDTDNSS